jgi:hypothetical protein
MRSKEECEVECPILGKGLFDPKAQLSLMLKMCLNISHPVHIEDFPSSSHRGFSIQFT